MDARLRFRCEAPKSQDTIIQVDDSDICARAFGDNVGNIGLGNPRTSGRFGSRSYLRSKRISIDVTESS